MRALLHAMIGYEKLILIAPKILSIPRRITRLTLRHEHGANGENTRRVDA